MRTAQESPAAVFDEFARALRPELIAISTLDPPEQRTLFAKTCRELSDWIDSARPEYAFCGIHQHVGRLAFLARLIGLDDAPIQLVGDTETHGEMAIGSVSVRVGLPFGGPIWSHPLGIFGHGPGEDGACGDVRRPMEAEAKTEVLYRLERWARAGENQLDHKLHGESDTVRLASWSVNVAKLALVNDIILQTVLDGPFTPVSGASEPRPEEDSSESHARDFCWIQLLGKPRWHFTGQARRVLVRLFEARNANDGWVPIRKSESPRAQPTLASMVRSQAKQRWQIEHAFRRNEIPAEAFGVLIQKDEKGRARLRPEIVRQLCAG